VQNIGLVDSLNQKVQVLKRHLPYYESDHVLNMSYNITASAFRMAIFEEGGSWWCAGMMSGS